MSIFNNENTGNEPTPVSAADLLAGIKNEKGEPKYASVEEALNGLAHAQDFISTLKTEKATLEQEVNARKSVEDALKGISDGSTPPATPAVNGMGLDDVKALVSQQLDSYKQQSAESGNVLSCEASLKTKFGDKAEEVLKNTASKLGRTVEELQSLAAKDPSLFLGLFNQEAPRPDNQPNVGSQRSDAFQGNPDSLLKANDKSLWSGDSRAVRNEYHASKAMVEELHAQGLETWDLTDPKIYFKHFANINK